MGRGGRENLAGWLEAFGGCDGSRCGPQTVAWAAAWRDGGAGAAEVEAARVQKPLPLVKGISGDLDALLVNDMLEEDAELPLA